MTKQTVIGGGLIAVAVLMWLSGVGDTIADLKDWHGLGTPSVVGTILKQAATVALSVIGGTLLPGIGSNKSEPLTVNLGKVEPL